MNTSQEPVITRKHSSMMRTDRLSTISRSIPCISREEGLPTPLDTDPPGHMTCDACWEASLRAVKKSITSHCLFCVYSWLFYFINSIFVDNCLILKANWNPLHWDFSLLVDTITCLSFLYNDPLIPIYWCWTNFTAWGCKEYFHLPLLSLNVCNLHCLQVV